MQRSLILFLCFAAAAFAGPERNTYEVRSDVRAVTVFLDRALVERVAQVTLEPGESTLVLPDLPANLWDHSLQVSGTGPDGTSVLDVQSRNRFLAAEPSPEIRQLEEKLDGLRRQMDLLKDENGALNQEQRVLSDINRAATTVPTEGTAPRPSLDEWRNLLMFNAEEGRRIQAALRDVTLQMADLQNEIAAAERQLNEARGRIPGQRAVKQVEVRVATATQGPVALTVSYTVPGANWTPTYRARLDSETRRVALDYQAQVINRTGEAWTDIALTLSTARPSAGGSAPEPTPWIVEELQRYAAERQRAFEDGVIEMTPFEVSSNSDARASKAMLAAAPMQVAQATVETGLTSASFKVEAPATIPADGTNHRVSITTLDLSAGLRHDTTPKYNPAAFLTAKVTNDSDFPLLGGSMASFVDGAFIANTYLAATMANEEFDLALGVDDAVSIERTLINRFVEKTGFTNSGHRVTYEFAIEVANNHAGPITLKLSEPLPVSRHEKIIVKVIEPAARLIGTPDDNTAFQRDEQGILTWTGSLAAGAERTLALKFSIEHPADMDVTGVE